MKVLLVMIFFFIVIPTASAYSGVFDILNEKAYNESLDIVTEYKIPEQTVQESEHIRGWVDIVGFNKSVRLNGTEYSDGSEPIIKYGVWNTYLGWDNGLDYIKVTDVRSHTVDNLTTAEIDIHLRWYHSILVCITNQYGRHCHVHKTYYDEYATFSTCEDSPMQYPTIKQINPKITIYNYSFYPHIEIVLPVQQYESKTTFIYDNESITRVNMAGVAATGAVNLSECLYWEDESDLFVTKNDIAILKMDALDFNPSKLKIITSSPYETKNVADYIISTVEYDQEERIKKSGVLLPLLILIIFGYGVKKCMKLWSEMI